MRNRVEITGINTSELKVLPNEVMMELIVKSQNGDYHKALICYNYGSGGAQKHCFSKGIYQTKYSQKVMKYANNLTPA